MTGMSISSAGILMIKLNLISRAVVIHDDKLLLVKNHNRDFWSLPGGHWEFNDESLAECAVRETEEETGHKISLDDIIFCQELRKPNSIIIEVFWNATLADDNLREKNSNLQHVDVDEDSESEDVKWLNRDDLGDIDIRARPIKQYFADGIKSSVFIDVFRYDN